MDDRFQSRNQRGTCHAGVAALIFAQSRPAPMSWIDQRPDDAMDGAFTVVGPDDVRTCEPGAFREAMSRLGAAVHVITTAGPGGKTGATATAVCSVSDTPPTLLVCINRRS